MNEDQPGTETGAADSGPSIEETLSKTFEAIEARDAEGDTEGQDTGGADGAKSADAAADTDTASDEVAETTGQDSVEGKGTADDQPLSPPSRWSAADKEQFSSLPREAQSLVLKREADVERHLTQESQKLAETKRAYEPIERLIKPRAEAWALQGHSLETGLNTLLALSDFASRDKPGFIRWYAQNNAIDLSELANAGGDTQPDPQIKALESRVARFEQTEQQRQQAQVHERQTQVASAIESFAADTKAHPYYKDVEADVATLLPGIVQQNPGASHKELLEIAYKKAIRVNDTVFAKMVAEEKRKTDLDAAKAAEKAKKVGSTNVKSSGSVPDGRRKQTMDETMSLTYDQAHARA